MGEATAMVATMARGPLMPRLTMEAMAMAVTTARGLLMLTTEVTAMVATTANALLMLKPTTTAAMAHTAMASKLHGNIHSLLTSLGQNTESDQNFKSQLFSLNAYNWKYKIDPLF